MTETTTRIRLATTAIAAVLAISSTPLLAQDATAPDTPVETTATPSADPLAPASTTEPIVPTTAAPEVTPEAAPVATETPTRTTRTTTVRRTTAAARRAPAAAQPAVTSAPAAAVAEPAPAPIVAEPAPLAPVEPVAVEPAASREAQTGVFMAIAAAAAVLAALVAALVALRRRRARREEELDNEVYEAEAEVVEPTPAMAAEPEPVPEPVRTEPSFVAAAAPAAAPAPAAEASHEVEGPVAELPEGFDLSKFGHHVQEAYKGPTEDNPSLSLKHRLRRAGGMDTMERNMDAEVEAATGESVLDEADATPPAGAPAAKPAVADPAPGDFMLDKPGKEPVKDPARTH